MKNVKESLDNGWNDRIFQHYRELVNADAVRPQDTESKEWKDIIAALQLKIDPNAPKNQKVIIKDGKAEIEVNETKTDVSKDKD
jgi:hypothetical protein